MHATDVHGDRRVAVVGGLGIRPADRLSGPSRRLLAHLAVSGPRQLRTVISSRLWSDVPETRARANLRRALWQLPARWVVVDGPDLVLDASVDLHELRAIAGRAVLGQALTWDQVEALSRDLLPGWYDEWLIGEQEQFRLLRVQALEAACRTASIRGEHALAAQAGLGAVAAEPLRESAVVALVQAHLHEGNQYEAVRRFRSYARLLAHELGCRPGFELQSLVSSALGPADSTA